VALLACLSALAFANAAAGARYVVVYDRHVSPPLAARHVESAGGILVATYPEIGVVIAEASASSFEAGIETFPRVAGAAATAAFATTAAYDDGDGPHEGSLPNEPATDGDTYSRRQWALSLIHATEAHAITGGSPEVLVGDIDTGIDASHPDLAPNLASSASASCVGGAPNGDPAAWSDDSGHGTHTAGIIAAASNGTGVVGVAPNVRIAAIKASIRQGTRDVFLPEAVICSFMWAAANGVDVANNSYSVDSAQVGGTTVFCEDNENQEIVIEGVRRAVRWAMFRGVTVVASAGNSNADLAGSGCLRLPSGLHGVLTVSSVGPSGQKASYSNYGLGVVDVAAPGGEVPPFAAPPSSFVLSTWPAKAQLFSTTTFCDPRAHPTVDPPAVPCPSPGTVPGVSYYRFLAGTSQASAHVSGVAALVVSRFGRAHASFIGQMRPRRVARIVKRTADPIACPADARCQSDGDENGFYGHGLVNAFRAVTRDTD
jgi:subtilisin family serine protease